jgi:hypothetical protein
LVASSKSGLWIRIDFNPEPAFNRNPDPSKENWEKVKVKFCLVEIIAYSKNLKFELKTI